MEEEGYKSYGKVVWRPDLVPEEVRQKVLEETHIVAYHQGKLVSAIDLGLLRSACESDEQYVQIAYNALDDLLNRDLDAVSTPEGEVAHILGVESEGIDFDYAEFVHEAANRVKHLIPDWPEGL